MASEPPRSLLQLWSTTPTISTPEQWDHYACTWSADGVQRRYRDGLLVREQPEPWVAPHRPQYLKLLWAASSRPAPRPLAQVAYRRVAGYDGALDPPTIRRLFLAHRP